MDVGERWGYRAHEREALVEVAVEAIGHKLPARVRVAFIDDSFEGQTLWVPPSRLKVVWGDRNAYLDAAQVWADFADLAPVDRAGEDAAEIVFSVVVPRSVAALYRLQGRRRSLCVRDVKALAALLEISEEEIEETRPKIVDQDGLHLPWPFVLASARTLARCYAGPVLADLTVQEEEVKRHDRYTSKSRRRVAPSPKMIALEARWRRESDLVRAWCGEPALALSQQLREAREELVWLANMYDLAVGALADEGAASKA
jgi:hypothetical protein